jgi:hypothetical protein
MRLRLSVAGLLLSSACTCSGVIGSIGTDGGGDGGLIEPDAAGIDSGSGNPDSGGRLDASAQMDAGAGPDASTEQPDAGKPDASTIADAGSIKDGGSRADAGVGVDAGTDAGLAVTDGGFPLSVSIYGSGAGSVSGGGGSIVCPSACSATFSAGTKVTLTATPTGGSAFLTWGGACQGVTATCTVTMTAAEAVTATFNPPSSLPGVYTWKYDNTRQGQNTSEATLTVANVNMQTFGAIASYAVDGYTYAEPLYVANVSVPGQGVHNVVYVVTEHDSAFAFDADGITSAPLWQDSFINPPSVTTVPAADTGETGDVVPEHGIMGTPVIDPSTQTIYVVVNTKETTGGTSYHYRLHALDLGSGTEKFNGPVEITATAGSVTLDPLVHMQRPGLLLLNGTVYIAFGSHGDHNTYQGWVLGYDPTTLAQVSSYCTNPTGGSGNAIWQAGAGLVADSSGNIYFETANGPYDGTNLGDTVVKLSTTGGLSVADYFTPSDQAVLAGADIDLGSCGPILLPSSVGTAAHPNLVLASGKPGVFYLLDGSNMGKYQSGGNNTQILQVLPVDSLFPNTSDVTAGVFNTMAFWDRGGSSTGTLYVSPANDTCGSDMMHAFDISGAVISASPASSSPEAFGYPGIAPVITSNGATNGIVWGIEVGSYSPSNPAILHAFDATNLGNELYTSADAANGRDQAGPAVKFTVPLVVNGKVYVGSQTTLTVYGLLP